MSTSTFLSSFLKQLRVGTRQDPARDWILSLIFSAIVLAGIIVWNAWAFDTAYRGGIIGSSVTSFPQVLSNSSLGAIHIIFEKRAAEEAKYGAGTYRFVSPSQ
jgi:hypothetical protein